MIVDRILYIILLGVLCLCSACENRKVEAEAEQPQTKPEKKKEYLPLDDLQGVWVDADSQSPFMWVRGDSVYYADNISVAAQVRLSQDSLWLGQEGYQVESRGMSRLSLLTLTGNTVSLQKTQHPEDSLLFMLVPAEPVVYTERTDRDTVTFCGEHRLHSYVTVNPTTHKVFRTSYNAEGMAVENYSFDNVIHLSVYEGKKCLFRSNFEKTDFAKFVPEEFLSQAILSDITFGPTDAKGAHFHALVCIPEGTACYMIELTVSLGGEVTMALRDY
ncbi:MAG: DUF4738 domain-containing protein [Bacteroidaceae bacterium]|nr:DUF4738 domain-containing protein [Bacteroidaceae bacterium]